MVADNENKNKKAFFIRISTEEDRILDVIRKLFRDKTKSRAFEEALQRFLTLPDEVGSYKHYSSRTLSHGEPIGRNFYVPDGLVDKLERLCRKYGWRKSHVARSAIIDLGIAFGFTPKTRTGAAPTQPKRPRHLNNVRVCFTDAELEALTEVKDRLGNANRSQLVEQALREFLPAVRASGRFPYRSDLRIDTTQLRRGFNIAPEIADLARRTAAEYGWAFTDVVRAAVLTYLDAQGRARDGTPH